MKVYGPYTRKKDGRRHMVIVRDDGATTSISYPKYLMQQKLGRDLLPDEEVDHIDRDFRNDALENLQVLRRPEHRQLDVRRVLKVVTACIWCSVELVRSPSQIRHNAKLGRAGPFCKPCAGHYGVQVQHGGGRLPAQPSTTPQAYRLPKTNASVAEWNT